jgi:hypothetical protein
MTQAVDITARMLSHRFPAMCGSTTPADSERQEAVPSTPCAPAVDFEQFIATMILTPKDLALIYGLAQISMPAPYFHSYFAWSGVRRLLQPVAGQPIRVAELQAALTEMADSMRVLVDTATVNDTEAVPAIRFSLLLIDAVQMALALKTMPT